LKNTVPPYAHRKNVYHRENNMKKRKRKMWKRKEEMEDERKMEYCMNR
jgi:hypothetical protein